jgi:thiol-disulfide isomerase/thioredoxin
MQLFQKPIPLLLCMILLFYGPLPTAAQPVLFPGHVENDSLVSFRLEATNGQKLHYKTETTLSCFVFLSPDCPLCKNYAALINRLKQSYRTDVTFYLIVPGSSYSMGEIKNFSKDYLKHAVLYKDARLRLTQYLRATTTPEVLLLENKTGDAVYKGALDDWAVSLGRQRTKATENYLVDAIEKYLHNEPVTVAYKEPVGCLINDF